MSDEELFVAIAGMIFTLLLFSLVIGGVLLFPITRRLGAMLKAKERAQSEESRTPAIGNADVGQILNALQAVHARLDVMEERQSFAEALLEERQKPVLPRA